MIHLFNKEALLLSPDKQKIVLVSSGQPGANPRLVKEATALCGAGYPVTVIYCALSPWADAHDQELFRHYPAIRWVRAGFHPHKSPWGYRYARLRQKIYQQLWRFKPGDAWQAIRSMVLYSQELLAEACAIEADLYIGHNLGALPAVVAAARKYGKFCAFDFEDYHRGEEPPGSIHAQKVTTVEDEFVPGLSYATAASPLIAAAYRRHYPQLDITTINNCFPVGYATGQRQLPDQPLKLFWFSQFVGPKRGLETVIEAMGKLPSQMVQLTMLGNVSEIHRAYFLSLAAKNELSEDQIVFLPPVHEEQIVQLAAQHHIGLACEVPHVPNRDLCLTNKIFMYLLAGNAVLFSETRAQQQFLTVHPGVGGCFRHDDAHALAALLQGYLDEPGKLRAHRASSAMLGQQSLNWELEKEGFLELVRRHIGQRKDDSVR